MLLLISLIIIIVYVSSYKITSSSSYIYTSHHTSSRGISSISRSSSRHCTSLHSYVNSNANTDKLYDEASKLTVVNNMTATLINLIEYGDNYVINSDTNNEYNINTNSIKATSFLPIHSSWAKVSGCMADVRMKVNVDQSNDNYPVTINAVADSRVARGMAALLSTGLQQLPANSILQLIPSEVTNKCGLVSLLPPGRLNGFENMINLIQSEIKNELGYNDKNIKQSSSNSGSWIKDGENDEIAVLLSGGVDSSVALKLLQEQGHKVRAFYLKIWLEDEVAHLNQCPWEEDLQYAQSVCEQLNVPLETLSLQKEYWNEVVQYTIKEAENGFTPNPDIMCNSRIKFGMFYEYVGKYFPKVATGHYAQVKIDKDTGKARLIMSPDAIKDQTYFLSNLRQDQLAKALFPIGHLQKSEVRELAQQYNLPTQVRKDSQGICFLGKLKFDDFIAHYLGESHGPIVDYKTGKLLGQHKGLWFHTIGQRKGIGLLLGPGSVHLGPWIVAAKDATTNTLYATNDLDVVERPRLEFKVEKINWVSGDLPLNLNIDGDDIEIKLRHGPNFNKGRIYIDKSYSSASVKLTDRDKGIAPGQFAAFYRNKECLGAGIIASTTRDDYDTKESVQLINEEITFIEP